jgi:hypothetical protein
MKFVSKGGSGSGHHGHAGRPGEIGGSLPEDSPQRDMMDFVNNVASMQDNSIYGVVRRHGQFYTPQPLPKKYKMGKIKECYSNAYRLSQKHGLQYVEGLAFPDFMNIPIEHAWCVDSDGNVIDNTWKIPGTVYYGIPFEDDFISRVFAETETFGVIKLYSETFRNKYCV